MKADKKAEGNRRTIAPGHDEHSPAPRLVLQLVITQVPKLVDTALGRVVVACGAPNPTRMRTSCSPRIPLALTRVVSLALGEVRRGDALRTVMASE
jgi:hypothetical protein